MSEVNLGERQRTDEISRYESFLRDVASRWPEVKEAAGVVIDEPGSRRAYEQTADAIVTIADESRMWEKKRGAFVSGTTAIMRNHHIWALKAREAGLDIRQTGQLIHNTSTYRRMAGIAAQPLLINRQVERSVALTSGLNPQDPLFWDRYQIITDGDGEATGDITGLARQLQAYRHDEDLRYDVETVMLRTGRDHSGCDALRSGQLLPIYVALADIVQSDPDLLAATLAQTAE
jgi:hypothetical protein